LNLDRLPGGAKARPPAASSCLKSRTAARRARRIASIDRMLRDSTAIGAIVPMSRVLMSAVPMPVDLTQLSLARVNRM
jgi:hypothetical protein